MSTQQPVWKCEGHIGDVDPIAHGGGFIYVDETGVYGPEMTWFTPGPDAEWQEKQGATKLKAYRVLLEREPENEWWWDTLGEVAKFVGTGTEELQGLAKDPSPVIRSLLYHYLIHYHGAENFDTEPVEMTEDEAYKRYAEEMKISLGRGAK